MVERGHTQQAEEEAVVRRIALEVVEAVAVVHHIAEEVVVAALVVAAVDMCMVEQELAVEGAVVVELADNP